MKRKAFFLLAMFTAFLALAGCSKLSGDGIVLPSEEMLREIIPETAEITPEPFLELLKDTPFPEDLLEDVPLVFALDSSVWIEDFSGGSTVFYKPADGSGLSEEDSISVSEDYAFVNTQESELYYSLNDAGQLVLSSADFFESDSHIYLGDDYRIYSFPYENYTASLTYTGAGELDYADFSPEGNGYQISYNSYFQEIQITYSYQEEEEDGSYWDCHAAYDAEGRLENIRYFYDSAKDSLFSDGYIHANYDGKYQLVDTDAPGGVEAYLKGAEAPEKVVPEESAAPAEPSAPAASAPPEKSPEKNQIMDSFLKNDPAFWNQLKDLF